jgi:hypothetical protein
MSATTYASFTVTYYNLFLGGQDGTTGWYQKGYVTESITMLIVDKSNSRMLSGLGLYSRHDAVGLTNYAVKIGGVVKDTFGEYYQIMGMLKHTWGDQFGYYACDLSKLVDFPFISGFFGFEDDAHSGYAGSEFEDGFERGYWTL